MNQAALPGGSIAGVPNEAGSSGDGIRTLIEALPAAVYATDAEGFVTFYNRAAVVLAGRTPVLGSDRWCVTSRLCRPDGAPLSPEEYPTAIALNENRALGAMEVVAERPDGSRLFLLAYAGPIRDASGRLIGAVNLLVDIGERKAAEVQLHQAMNEFHHRMMNAMQMLQSLLIGAEREAASREARDILADAARRVGVMAALQHGPFLAAGNLEARVFLEALSRHAGQSFGRQVDIAIEASSGGLSQEAVLPLALIVNELISNAVKHGKGERGRVSVKLGLMIQEAEWVLSVEDDGPGFVLEKPRRRASGLGLVIGLAGQLGGRLDVTKTSSGARCVVSFRAGPRHSS